MFLSIDSLTIPDIIITAVLGLLGWLIVTLYMDLKGEIKELRMWKEKFLENYNKDKAQAVEQNNQLGEDVLKEMNEIKINAVKIAAELKNNR